MLEDTEGTIQKWKIPRETGSIGYTIQRKKTQTGNTVCVEHHCEQTKMLTNLFFG